ncbi:MAG: UvrD-helicase domain-containing protein, partial [Ruminococcus sp.]|nr:UvrD-helicase domain-containing protein [Ruminococcus sp.]
MSEINWNKKQLEAIEKDGTGIVVSAAAGSGKTTVMIERLSRLLLDENNKIPAQNLLAVTFTTKAAASMRVKLNSAVDKEINKCFSSAEMRQSEKSKWLLEQKSNLQFAKVSTINSFCLEFVKD